MYKKIALLVFFVCTYMVGLEKTHLFDVYDYYTDYHKVMLDLYADIDAVIPDVERQCVTKTGGSPVYGEILFDSVNFLLDDLQLTQNDVFYDLGSGLGKFVLQVYFMTPAKKSVGIEFSESRHKRAASVQSKALKIYKESFNFENDMRKMFGKTLLPKTKGKECACIKGCMLETDISDATVVFTCSTCFDEKFMQKLTDKLGAIDDLRIISLRQLPYHKHIHYVTKHVLPMTWSSDVPVHMYHVDQSKIASDSEQTME